MQGLCLYSIKARYSELGLKLFWIENSVSWLAKKFPTGWFSNMAEVEA
jgi:hypothetical protein